MSFATPSTHEADSYSRRQSRIVGILLRLVKLAVIPYGAVFRERRRGLVILGYHRIGGGTDSEIDLPTDAFTRQMAYLRDHYTIVSMEALLDGSIHNGIDGQSDLVAVTFDDGYREIYEHAFPVLLRYGIPATVYLATRYIDAQQHFDFGRYARQEVRPAPLTWEQTRDMMTSGLVTVGAHAHSHADLTRLSVEAVREEVAQCRRVIADRLGSAPRHFAYPWGVLTPAVQRVVGECFQTAVRGGCGKNLLPSLQPLALWRQPVQQSDGFWLFTLKVRSYLDGEEYFRGLAVRHRS